MVKLKYQYSHKSVREREGSGMGAVSPKRTNWFKNTEEFLRYYASIHGTLSVNPNTYTATHSRGNV